MRVAPEGWPFILPGLALTCLSAMGGILVPETNSTLRNVAWAGAAVAGLVTALVLYFFRNPVRIRRDGEGLVLAPADGKIVQIVSMDDTDLFVGPATRISIFLTVFNVHVQRAPVTGRVELRHYQEGRFSMAWKGEASEGNEQATLGIAAGPHRVMVRQIAGWVARRIVTDPQKGDLVPQGSRIGIIRFGSRVDLFIPQGWELTCKVGDRVRGGLTGLARMPAGPQRRAG